ncbi:MAG: DUF99 family protein [Candidatus Bathyarchaeota archaeon]
MFTPKGEKWVQSLTREVKFRKIKKEIRIVGIDDCPFVSRSFGKADVIGAVLRGGHSLDGIVHTNVDIDGFDATEKISEMITLSPHHHQLRIIMLDGITFAGFNIVDIARLFELTGIPVIALTRAKTDMDNVRNALKNLPNWGERWLMIQRAGPILKLRIGETELQTHVAGVSNEDAEKVIRISSTRGNIPEPLRVAHLIASGLGEQNDQ